MNERALSLICLSVFTLFSSVSSLAVSTCSASLTSLFPSSLLSPFLLFFCLPPFRERMKLPFMTDQCEQMLKICDEFVRLEVSYEEYLCMKVLLLLSTGNEMFVALKSHSGVFQTSGTAIILGLKQNHLPVRLSRLCNTAEAFTLQCEAGSVCHSGVVV